MYSENRRQELIDSTLEKLCFIFVAPVTALKLLRSSLSNSLRNSLRTAVFCAATGYCFHPLATSADSPSLGSASGSMQPNDVWVVFGVADTHKQTRKPLAINHLSLAVENSLQSLKQNVLGVDVVTKRLMDRSRFPFQEIERDIAENTKKVEKHTLDELLDLHYGEVERLWQDVKVLYAGSMSAVGRHPELSESFSNICLFSVRAFLEHRKTPQAEKRALECLRLVPDLIADPRWHTPEVGNLLKNVQEVANRTHTGMLHIFVESGFYPGCSVRVNGRQMSASKSAIVRLLDGVYEVMLECPSELPRYLYPATVTVGGNTPVLINASIDRAFAMFPRAHFDDANWAQNVPLQVQKIGAVASAVGATRMIIVSAYEPDAAIMRYYQKPPQQYQWHPAAMAVIPHYETGRRFDKIQEALTALLERKSVDCRLEPTVPLTGDPTVVPPSPNLRVRTPLVAKSTSDVNLLRSPAFYALAVLGLFHIGSSIVWSSEQYLVTTRLQSASASQANDWLDSRDFAQVATMWSGVAALAFASIYWPLALPKQDTTQGDSVVPLPAWILGGLGAGLVTAGVFAFTSHRDCDAWGGSNANCLGGAHASPVGPSMLMQGGMLLGIPITYVLRHWLRSDEKPTANGAQPSVSQALQNVPTIMPWIAPASPMGGTATRISISAGAQLHLKW